MIVALLMPRAGRAFRADLRALDRFDADDRRWFRRGRRGTARPAKFDPGQKLNAAVLAASGVVLFGTGLMLRWPDRFSVDLRTGATFVHDWFAIGVTVAIAGHVVFALRDRTALWGMLRGRVPTRWARRTHPRWYEEVTGQSADRLATSTPVPKAGSAAARPR